VETLPGSRPFCEEVSNGLVEFLAFFVEFVIRLMP